MLAGSIRLGVIFKTVLNVQTVPAREVYGIQHLITEYSALLLEVHRCVLYFVDLKMGFLVKQRAPPQSNEL